MIWRTRKDVPQITKWQICYLKYGEWELVLFLLWLNSELHPNVNLKPSWNVPLDRNGSMIHTKNIGCMALENFLSLFCFSLKSCLLYLQIKNLEESSELICPLDNDPIKCHSQRHLPFSLHITVHWVLSISEMPPFALALSDKNFIFWLSCHEKCLESVPTEKLLNGNGIFHFQLFFLSMAQI